MGGNERRKGDPFWEVQRGYRQEQSLPCNWQPFYFFMSVNDKSLLTATCGKFPRGKLSQDLKTHPVFLLKRISNYSYRFCPCSSEKWGDYSHIPAATKIELAPVPFPKNSHICHDIFFSLTPQNDMIGTEQFYGIVQESDIVGEQYKEGIR